MGGGGGGGGEPRPIFLFTQLLCSETKIVRNVSIHI